MDACMQRAVPVKQSALPGRLQVSALQQKRLHATGLGIDDAEVPHELEEELALRMHTAMVRLQTMDVIFYEAQRQVSAPHLSTALPACLGRVDTALRAGLKHSSPETVAHLAAPSSMAKACGKKRLLAPI
jgi:hypothetical protein